MNGYGVISHGYFDYELCKILELGDEIIINFLDVEKDISYCFVFISFVELFESVVHNLWIVYRYLF